MTNHRLKKELLAQGASADEAENLARLAEQLAAVKPRGLSARAKQRMYDELPIHTSKARRPMFRLAMGGSLAAAMALLALLVLPGILRPDSPAQPDKDDVSSLVQPVETELQELDMQIEELQQQPTINEAELQEAEQKYQRTFERLKNNYQNRKEFKNYDWNKWHRNFRTQHNDKNPNKNNREEENRKRQNTNLENNYRQN